MSNLINFNFENHQVRTAINANNEPFFCLSDIAEILDIKNSRHVVTQLDEKGIEKIAIQTKGGIQEVTFINEPNLYRVIFRSNKAEARQFQDWVFNEVLPSIRKTGSYSNNNQALYELFSSSLGKLIDHARNLYQLNSIAHSDSLEHQFKWTCEHIHAIIAYCYENNITTPSGKPIFKDGQLNYIGGNSIAYSLPMLRLMKLI